MRRPIFPAIAIIMLTVLLSPSSAEENWGGPLESLSKQEMGELGSMVYHVCFFDLVRTDHEKFWEIVDSHKWSDKEVQEVFDRLLGRAYVRDRYMLRAVLDAYEKQKDTKSAEFREYEDRLLKMGVLSPKEIKKSDEFIYKVAHGKPVEIYGIFGGPWAEAVFNDEWAENYRTNLAILDKHYRSFLLLFDRNWKGE